MSAIISNTYGPEQLLALQAVFDRAWLQISDSHDISRNDLARSIFALTANGRMSSDGEIDAQGLFAAVRETLSRSAVTTTGQSQPYVRPVTWLDHLAA